MKTTNGRLATKVKAPLRSEHPKPLNSEIRHALCIEAARLLRKAEKLAAQSEAAHLAACAIERRIEQFGK